MEDGICSGASNQITLCQLSIREKKQGHCPMSQVSYMREVAEYPQSLNRSPDAKSSLMLVLKRLRKDLFLSFSAFSVFSLSTIHSIFHKVARFNFPVGRSENTIPLV